VQRPEQPRSHLRLSVPIQAHPARGSPDIAPGRTDLELSGRHFAYRFGEVGEESSAHLLPYLPLSISFGPDKLGASRTTLKYGLIRDDWSESVLQPSDHDRRILLTLALRRLREDVRAAEAGGAVVRGNRHFLRP
jgi:hypothetical protein